MQNAALTKSSPSSVIAMTSEQATLASQGVRGSTTEEGQDSDIADLLPIRNNIGLPLANPPPPANSTQSQRLFPVNRFWGKILSFLID